MKKVVQGLRQRPVDPDQGQHLGDHLMWVSGLEMVNWRPALMGWVCGHPDLLVLEAWVTVNQAEHLEVVMKTEDLEAVVAVDLDQDLERVIVLEKHLADWFAELVSY